MHSWKILCLVWHFCKKILKRFLKLLNVWFISFLGRCMKFPNGKIFVNWYNKFQQICERINCDQILIKEFSFQCQDFSLLHPPSLERLLTVKLLGIVFSRVLHLWLVTSHSQDSRPLRWKGVFLWKKKSDSPPLQ